MTKTETTSRTDTAPTAVDAALIRKYDGFLVNRVVGGRSRAEQNLSNRRHRRKRRILAFAFLPLVVLIRLLRPIVRLRFGYVLKHKIGHCPFEAEIYLLEKHAGIQPKGTVDLFYFQRGTDGRSANLFAEWLARRNLPIFSWVEWLAAANEMLPGAEPHRVTVFMRDKQQFADYQGLMRDHAPRIRLTEEEEKLGRLMLERMGVPDGQPFVCFHVRDPGYWQARKEGIGADSDARNATLENFFPAMIAAANRGYYVLRMGASVSTPLPDLHPRVIDYATHHRTEFMDLFLTMRCNLMVSTASGIDAVAYWARRPMLYVDLCGWGWEFVGLPQPFMCIFKPCYRDGRLMTFEEITAVGAQDFVVNDDFVKAGIRLEENTPDEIEQAMSEMLDHLEGKRVLTQEDRDHQAKMRGYVSRSPRYKNWQFEVPAGYLRKYESLL